MACVKLTHKVSCEILCSGLWSMSLGHSCIRRAWAFKAPGEAGEPLFGNLRVHCDSQALLQKHPWIKKKPQILQLIYLVNLCCAFVCQKKHLPYGGMANGVSEPVGQAEATLQPKYGSLGTWWIAWLPWQLRCHFYVIPMGEGATPERKEEC